MDYFSLDENRNPHRIGASRGGWSKDASLLSLR
jgi:hypothetical protein